MQDKNAARQFLKEMQEYQAPKQPAVMQSKTFEKELKESSSRGTATDEEMRMLDDYTGGALSKEDPLVTGKPDFSASSGTKTGDANGTKAGQKMQITGTLKVSVDGSAQLDAEGGVPVNS